MLIHQIHTVLPSSKGLSLIIVCVQEKIRMKMESPNSGRALILYNCPFYLGTDQILNTLASIKHTIKQINSLSFSFPFIFNISLFKSSFQY